jgi:D-alanine-D-alanine ligase-like ATP-grasp enzyme
MLRLGNLLGRMRRKLVKGGRGRARAPKRRSGRPSFDAGKTGDSLAKALDARGIGYSHRRGDQIPVESMPRHHFLVFKLNGTLYCYSTRGDLCGAHADGKVAPITDEGIRAILAKKDLTKSILRRHGFSVPEGVAFHRDSLSEATSYFSALLPTAPHGICVKPTAGKRGRRVYLGLRDLPSFHAAFKAVAKAFDHVLVEEVVAGTVYRYFCLAGRMIAIRHGIPAKVEGDGTLSIAELVEAKNRQRARDGSGNAISMTGPGLALLDDQGMSLDSVPKAGEIVWLSRASNLDQGADIVDATDGVHPSYTALVEQAVQSFPGLLLCGADVAIEDASVPATADNHHFIELNETPGFHHYPAKEGFRDLAGAIVDYLASAHRPKPRPDGALEAGDVCPQV